MTPTRRELELRGRTHTGRLPKRTCWRGCPNGSGACPENLTRAHALVRARDRVGLLLGHGRFGGTFGGHLASSSQGVRSSRFELARPQIISLRARIARAAAEGEGDHDAHFDLRQRTRAHARRKSGQLSAALARPLPALPTNAAASLRACSFVLGLCPPRSLPVLTHHPRMRLLARVSSPAR